MTLSEHLEGAQVVVYDKERDLTVIWYGGHGVHAYDGTGREVHFWNTGDFARNDAGKKEVRKSIREHISHGYYGEDEE